MAYKYRYKRKQQTLNPFYIAIIILLLLVIFYIGLEKSSSEEIEMPEVSLKTLENFSTTLLNVPAVDTNGYGLNTVLKITVKPGTGKALTNIDVLLFWVDTQQSIQTARKVAKEITGVDIDQVDLEYTIEADNATVIGGPSAGAALTIATIAALQNKNLKEDVVITGTINGDGKIGKVGAILEKARAAKESGANTFLVPMGESSQIHIRPDEKCVKSPGFVYCETVYKQTQVNVGESIGIDVIEIDNMKEALPYFFE